MAAKEPGPELQWLKDSESEPLLVVGIDLVWTPLLDELRRTFPSVRMVSLTDRPLRSDLEHWPKRPARAWASLARRRYGAVIAAQDFRNLKLFVLSLPARQHLVVRNGRLTPFGIRDVGEQALRRWGHRWVEAILSRRVPPPRGPGNDYSFIEQRVRELEGRNWACLRVSVIVPVYNRRAILEKTLAGLVGQDYPRELTEVVVADDGSNDRPEAVRSMFEDRLAITVVRQEDRGYRLAAARNLARRAATGEVIVSLDCDMLPSPGFLSAHLRWFHAFAGPLLVIGARRDVDSSSLSPAEISRDFSVVGKLPAVDPPALVRRRSTHRDWQQDEIRRSRQLKDHPTPYSVAFGGNVSFWAAEATAAGGYDEGFQTWGGEDDDFAYRLYRRGAYFVPEPRALAFHQAHPPAVTREEGQRISRRRLGRKIPRYRHYASGGEWEAPKVSVYVPAYNAAQWIERAIDSALAQSLSDLEVCVCDDGSTDQTGELLQRRYGGEARVRWVAQENRGTAEAARRAVALCRGEYIMELDSDDELLPEAAAVLSAVLDRDPQLSLVYGGYRVISEAGTLVETVNARPYSPYHHLLGNIVSHPRMFRVRDYFRTGGFHELDIAEDFDLSLKLAEQGRVRAVPQILYHYRIHGQNASIVSAERMARYHLQVVQRALLRRQLDWCARTPDPKQPNRLALQSNQPLLREVAQWLKGVGSGGL